MIQPFRKIRKELLAEGSLKRYLLYGVGEILLVVIGILIALQINNWNERRIEKQVEREILVGIRDDILQDTIDIYFNIKATQNLIHNNEFLLDHLFKKKKYESWLGRRLLICGFSDYILTLHSSHFETAKQHGLEIISNKELRKQISRLYEYKYPYLQYLENEYLPHSTYEELKPLISNYIEINTHVYMTDSLFRNQYHTRLDSLSYPKLLSDKKLHNLIFQFTRKTKGVLINDYIPTKEAALKIVTLINEELANFD